MDHEIIISYNDTLNMLDDILEKRDHEWWNKFYADKNKPVPFFRNICNIHHNKFSKNSLKNRHVLF